MFSYILKINADKLLMKSDETAYYKITLNYHLSFC